MAPKLEYITGTSSATEDHESKKTYSTDKDMDLKLKMVSKTTYKLRSSEALTSEDDFELMEIPLVSYIF